MQILTANEAKEQFAKVGRRVVTRKQSVVVKFQFGFMKCEPWEIPEEVAPVAKGSRRRSKREIALGNSLGEIVRS